MTILIVEDEFPIRNGLTKLVQWENFGIELVLSAENGEQALQIYRQYTPEILLTDIRMPKMNGLELAQTVRILNPDVKLIFLSSYDDKEYFKTAIKLHAVDFIEKPTKPEALTAAVQYAIAQIKTERSHVQKADHFLSLRESLQEHLTSPDSVRHSFVYENLTLETREPLFYRMLYLKLAPDYSASKADEKIEEVLKRFFLNGICVYHNHIYYALVWNRTATDEQTLWRILKSVQQEVAFSLSLNTPPFTAASSAITEPAQLSRAIQSVNQVATQMFISGTDAIAVPVPTSEQIVCTFSRFTEEFSASLLYGEEAVTLAKLLNLRNEVRLLSYCNVDNIQTLCAELIMTINEASASQNLHLWEHLKSSCSRVLVSNFETFEDFYNELVEQVHKYYSAVNQKQSENQVANICVYINQNYASSSINTSEIAKFVHLSTTYVCHLFKKERNETISSYLNKVRVEKSKAYLLDNSIPLYEVASRVGYNDPNYYMRMFKKITGIPPSTYRAKRTANTRRKEP